MHLNDTAAEGGEIQQLHILISVIFPVNQKIISFALQHRRNIEDELIHKPLAQKCIVQIRAARNESGLISFLPEMVFIGFLLTFVSSIIFLHSQ